MVEKINPLSLRAKPKRARELANQGAIHKGKEGPVRLA